MILYHVTPARNVPMILKHGLRPSRRKGFTSKVDVAIPLKTGYLYFTDSLEAVGDLLTALAAVQSRPIRLALLEVEVSSNYPYFLESDIDPNATGMWADFLVSRYPIPPSKVRLLGEVDTGYSSTPGEWQELEETSLPSSTSLPRKAGERVDFGARRSIYGGGFGWKDPEGWSPGTGRESTDIEELKRIEEKFGDWETGFRTEG